MMEVSIFLQLLTFYCVLATADGDNQQTPNTCITRENSLTCIDPFAGQSTPLRESLRNKHSGTNFHIQGLDFQQNYLAAKVKGYEELTGATIEVTYTTTSTRFKDILEDIKGPGLIDLYAIFGNWVPTFVNEDGLMDITKQVGDQAGLDWFDIMPAVRTGVASFESKVYAIPLDGDVIIMLYRTDLVEKVGLPTPRTWDDVMKITDYYANKEDGEEYANCFSTDVDDIAGTIFWSIAATFLQTRGTSQGTFFDPESMDPLTNTAMFLKVLEVYKKLVQQSPFRDRGPTDWKETLDIFNERRCVLWYNYPGPTRNIISAQSHHNMTGDLNLLPVPGMKCSSEDCPHAVNGSNHAPFLASGGMAYAVNNRSPTEKQRAALDFSFYISDPAYGYWDVAVPGSFLDPLRRRHTVALRSPESPESQTFLNYGWEQRQLPMLRAVTEFNFLNDNYVLDLRVLGAREYIEDSTVPHLIRYCNDELSTKETAEAMTKSWRTVTEVFGLKEQRAMYRKTLGLPKLIEEETSAIRLDIIIPIVSIFGVAFIALIAIVAKQRYTIKYKTRDVNDAPRSGTVVLIFTDIEGSTNLWDSSKTSMARALDIHHGVVRQCIQKYRAYEVKTIGDAFMIAVGSADKAVQMANDIQLGLLNADWPIELATMPSACVDYFHSKGALPPKVMFKGLRVRIGVHLGEHSDEVEEGGEVQILYDDVTKGYDYYGPVVNTAARIESLGFGGQTLISSNVFDALSDEAKRVCSISAIGSMELRGVSGNFFLHQCLPTELGGRHFKGVYRRRESDGTSFSFGDSIAIHSLHSSEDMSTDIMTLTPVELQKSVARLRERVHLLELHHLSSGGTVVEEDTSGVEDNGVNVPRRRSLVEVDESSNNSDDVSALGEVEDARRRTDNDDHLSDDEDCSLISYEESNKVGEDAALLNNNATD